MTREEASKDFLEAVAEASSYALDDSCGYFVFEWLAGLTHQGLRREDLLASEEGAAAWAALCSTVEEKYGPAFDALAELERVATGSVARPAVSCSVLWSVERVASKSGTVWCSGAA